MESFMRRGRQWGRVVSVLFGLLALARARQQSEVESDVLRIPSDIYTGGPLIVALWNISKGDHGAPRPLLIGAPKESGKYPVVQFQHGWSLRNNDYTQLLHHVASYGFIAVAPQINCSTDIGLNATVEICAAASVMDWLQTGLIPILSEHLQSVKPKLDKLAAVGHSRGGKVVFGVATGVCKTTHKFSAIVGLGPVDGLPLFGQTMPPILHFLPHDLKLGMPTLIVGTGLNYPPPFTCEPVHLSHQEFFNESDAPAFHFVAPNNGHLDLLNGECPLLTPDLSCKACKKGPDRQHMRNFSAGITVAFLQGYLNNNFSHFCDAAINYPNAPVILEKPESYHRLPPECGVTQEA